MPLLLQGSLLERIDAAGQGKKTAQLAAVIGREFDSELLFKLSDESPKVVQEHLDQLSGLNILSRTAINQRIFYSFRHALLRDAVYSSLLHVSRTAVHCNVASLLRAERQSYSAEVIARHYEECGNQRLAFQYWLEAGRHAFQNGATREAVDLFAKADRLVGQLDGSHETIRDIAELYIGYGHALNVTHGVVAQPIKYFRLAESYAALLNDTGLLLTSLDWQFGMLFNAGDLKASLEPARKLKDLGSSAADPTVMACGYQASGMANFMSGAFQEAQREFEDGLATAGDHISGKHCFPSMTLSYLAWTYIALGERQRAEDCIESSIASARRESPYALSIALSNCCYVCQSMGAVDKIYGLTDELLAHAAKHGQHMILERGKMTRNWADCVSGRGDLALETIRAHIDQLLSSGEEVEVTYHLGLLAALEIHLRNFTAAADSLRQAFAIADKNGEHFYLAELYRLMHSLLEAAPALRAPGDDEDYLEAAQRTANAQGSRPWLDQLASTDLYEQLSP